MQSGIAADVSAGGLKKHCSHFLTGDAEQCFNFVAVICISPLLVVGST